MSEPRAEPKCVDCGQPALWQEGRSWFCDDCRLDVTSAAPVAELDRLRAKVAELEEKVREYGEEQHRLNKCLEMAGDVRDAAYAELDRLWARISNLETENKRIKGEV